MIDHEQRARSRAIARERVAARHRKMSDRCITEWARRGEHVSAGGDPADFVSAPELPRDICDPLYDPRR